MKTFTSKERIECEILHFCDGDTVYIRAHCPCCGLSKKIYVRLQGIESYEPKGTDANITKTISHKWTNKYAGQKAELLCTQIGSDKYGRVVGAIFINGKSLADELVLSGDSWHYNHKTKRV